MRILVVDDDRSMRFLLERALGRLGHAVEAYPDAEQALAAFRAASAAYDAVITDQSLPGLAGLELAQALHELRADLPVVLVSGHVNDELRALAREARVTHVLEKPVSVKTLGEVVEQLRPEEG